MIQIEVIVLYDYPVLTLVLRSRLILKIEPISVSQIRVLTSYFLRLLVISVKTKRSFLMKLF